MLWVCLFENFPIPFFTWVKNVKLTCWKYRFGAVMEEFEVRDALENILSMKPELGMGY